MNIITELTKHINKIKYIKYKNLCGRLILTKNNYDINRELIYFIFKNKIFVDVYECSNNEVIYVNYMQFNDVVFVYENHDFSLNLIIWNNIIFINIFFARMVYYIKDNYLEYKEFRLMYKMLNDYIINLLSKSNNNYVLYASITYMNKFNIFYIKKLLYLFKKYFPIIYINFCVILPYFIGKIYKLYNRKNKDNNIIIYSIHTKVDASISFNSNNYIINDMYNNSFCVWNCEVNKEIIKCICNKKIIYNKLLYFFILIIL